MTDVLPAPDSDIAARLDPALRHLAAARTNLSADLLGKVRDSLNQRRREAVDALTADGVHITDDVVVDGHRHVPVRIYRGGAQDGPAVVYCHSGAFVLGNLDTDHLQCVEMARGARCTVVSVDYRLAPEHPYPAGLDDALAVLRWAAESFADVGVAGSSAGGALAAGLAQRSARGEAPPVLFQVLHQPVLDDRQTPAKQEFVTTPGFDSVAAAQMWLHYGGVAALPDDAVPARAADVSGVAAALITCSGLDPLRDEAVDYARRLMSAGVPVELHVFAGTCHGFDSLVPDWAVSRQLFAMQAEALRRSLRGCE